MSSDITLPSPVERKPSVLTGELLNRQEQVVSALRACGVDSLLVEYEGDDGHMAIESIHCKPPMDLDQVLPYFGDPAETTLGALVQCLSTSLVSHCTEKCQNSMGAGGVLSIQVQTGEVTLVHGDNRLFTEYEPEVLEHVLETLEESPNTELRATRLNKVDVILLLGELEMHGIHHVECEYFGEGDNGEHFEVIGRNLSGDRVDLSFMVNELTPMQKAPSAVLGIGSYQTDGHGVKWVKSPLRKSCKETAEAAVNQLFGAMIQAKHGNYMDEEGGGGSVCLDIRTAQAKFNMHNTVMKRRFVAHDVPGVPADRDESHLNRAIRPTF